MHGLKKFCSEWQELSEWIWVFAFILYPGLLPGPAQAVSTTQTRTSAQNTMIWFLQRAAAWLRNLQKSQTHRCSSNICSLCSILYVFVNVKGSLFVCINCLFVIYLYLSMCAHRHLLEYLRNSALHCWLYSVIVSVHNVVSFLCHSPGCVWPAELIRYSYSNTHGEMRD